MSIKKPECCREMTPEEMSFDDGGSKIPWWGWTLIGVAAAGALTGIGFGIARACSSATVETAAMSTAPGNMYDLEIIPLNKVDDMREMIRLQKEGYTVLPKPIYPGDGSVYFSLIRKR